MASSKGMTAVQYYASTSNRKDGARAAHVLVCVLAALLLYAGCASPDPPGVDFDRAYRAYIHGDMAASRKFAEEGALRFAKSDPQWSWKFRALEAEILVFDGESERALEILSHFPPVLPPEIAIDVLALRTIAQARLHRFEDASSSLVEAQRLCATNPLPVCGGVLRSQGFLAVQRGDDQEASVYFQASLDFARTHGDKYLATTALMNLGWCAMHLHHFDEAIDWLERARSSAADLDAGLAETKAVGNLGWVFYNLGDLDRSLALTLEAKQRAIDLGDGFDELAWEMNAGQVYAAHGEATQAEKSFQQALERARKLNSKQDIFDSLTVLAALGLQTGNFAAARRYSDEELAMARTDGNHPAELEALLIQGTIATRKQDTTVAESILHSVIHDSAANDSLKWEAEYALAKMYEESDKKDAANRSYRDALASFERARSKISQDELRLPFLTNASNIYEDYVEFLVKQGASAQALAIADFGRAQTLAEGLGVIKTEPSFSPSAADPRTTARRQRALVLFYSLGSKRSYLWAITAHEVRSFVLPPASEIEQQVQRYRKALAGPGDVLLAGNTSLFETLVAPVVQGLQGMSRIIIIPDGSLNSLNFETLVVSNPTPHYWIEDATFAYASSLRLLSGTQRTVPVPDRKLLLMGDAVTSGNQYSPLPHARAEMEMVARHFDHSSENMLAGSLATPAAYIESQPGRFSFLHFVAHGTANRLTPLDSAVILSPSDRNQESYKLYSREILRHPLNTELVTISSCYGSGSRTYSGEGLVGLSWAFLRAGAHHVIGALWEVSDDSTPQLMDILYGELAKGQPPESALRTAKLSLLHSGTVFRKPFYWGPFQLYLGS